MGRHERNVRLLSDVQSAVSGVASELPDNRNARYRRRTAAAVMAWSALPLYSAVMAVVNATWTSALTFSLIVLCAVTAASLAVRKNKRSQSIAAGLLLLLSVPFGVQLANHFWLGTTTRVLAVADSPLGYFMGVVVNALLFVPVVVFAQSIWRRRSQQTVPLEPQPNST